jgi:Domain of unknown function (DUF3471)
MQKWRIRKFVLPLLATLCLETPCAFGQWPDRTPGIPRTADGKPDLRAPAPKTADGRPDLSGVWQMAVGPFVFDIMSGVKPDVVQPWARSLYEQRANNLGSDRWTVKCLPGGPALGLDRQIAKIAQTPGLLVILYEDLTYRQIFLDGRSLPKDPNPTWMGYSTGHWEGATLVVESAGFNNRTWLDYGGHPHSKDLHITERYRRFDAGHLSVAITYDDPGAYSRPWTVSLKYTLLPDTDLIEYVCAENEKDRPHLVGKASDDLKNAAKLAPEVLAKYAGIYEMSVPGAPAPIPLQIRLVDGGLTMDFAGGMPLIAVSQTEFVTSAGARVKFELDSSGAVTGLTLTAIEGERHARRRR